jgi:hypothetical protein
MCARGAVTTRSSRVRWRGDALDGGAVGAGRRQGASGEHRWGLGVAPGRRSGGGAHPSGGLACGGGAGCQHRGSGRRRGKRGSGERGAVLWLEAEAREVAAVRHQSEEAEKKSASDGRVPFFRGGR